MSSPDQATEKKDVAATATPPADGPEAPAAPAEKEESKEAQSGDASDEAKGTEIAPAGRPAETAEPAAEPEKPAETTEPETQPEKSQEEDEKKDESADVEMKDSTEGAPAEPETGKKEEPPIDKAKAQSRRKSSGGSEPKGKKLNKKQSKASLTNLNAQPGDQYLVKLKGFPPWPAVICDEDMLPGPILASRPVTAKRADGTYREDFADGGKRAKDRTFPVMYLYTNEFGWVPNTSLQELSPEAASAAINDKMRKDLQSAYDLASKGNDLTFYKGLLQQFQEELVAKEEAQKAKKKKRASAVDEMDIDAVDKTPAKKSKKRKAEDEVATPQRTDSAKKPKIKLTGSSAKAAANGAATPKSAGQGASKSSSKAKAKKAADRDETPGSKKPELTEKERHERRVKEVYYLRHKLQKGLFPKEQTIKAEDMPAMGEFFTRLEDFTEMDASILRATRIHKLPKAIMRLESIPREDEFNFKSRSNGLLEKWNKILAEAPPAEETPAPVNGAAEAKDGNNAKTGANGTDKADAKAAPAEKTEAKDESNGKDNAEEKPEPNSEENKAPAAVEASA